MKGKENCILIVKEIFLSISMKKNVLPGWVENGTFQYTHIDEDGEEHIVGYSFTNEYVCDYSSFMKGSLSLVSIQAITDCSVYEISHHDMIEYWETNMETQRFGRCVAENLYGNSQSYTLEIEK